VTAGLIAANVIAYLVSFTPMHTTAAQLIVNMVYLWIFGENVEDRLGRGRFLLFYVLGVLGTGMARAFVALEPDVPLLGAAGGVGALLGAYFVLFPRSRVLLLVPLPLKLVEAPAFVLLGFWLSLQLAIWIKLAVPQSAGTAAITLLFSLGLGAVLCLLLRRKERLRVDWWGA
jgi:membrane associated rhomboid family serine protease